MFVVSRIPVKSSAPNPIDPPQRDSTLLPYTADDMVRLRAAFASVANSYRRHRRISTWAVGVGICALALTVGPRGGPPFLQPPWRWCAAGLLLMCVVVYAGAVITSPRLVCPGCGEALDKGFVLYCPECGSKRLDRDWSDSKACEDCGATVRHGPRGGQSHWTIRACTSCGLILDTQGLKR